MERTRIVAYWMYANITKYEKSRKGIMEFMPLPSDVSEEKKYLSTDEFIAAQNQFAKALKKKKK